MVTRWDMDSLWRPSDKLNVACQELQEAQEWLQGRKLMNVPLTPVPMGESPAWRKRITPADGPVGVTPMKDGGSLPHKTIGGLLPDKTVERMRMALPKDNNGGHADGVASAQDGEDRKDDRSSQGEDEVDKMQDEAMSEALMRQKTQVAIEDQKEHILAVGKWAGLGAVWKVNEVHVNVSGTEIGGLN